MKWKVYILTTDTQGKTNSFERVEGDNNLFIDWGMLAQQYNCIDFRGVKYLIIKNEVGKYYVSEPLPNR